tara:strand:- start:170 stop:772 length:603 start_codon:yes stop_codon:yes gene_type:complete
MNDINPFDILSIKMCSPMIVFIVFVIVSAISLFMSRNILKRFGKHKVDNLYNLHSWHEIQLILVFGVVLFGLCQYNQLTLAWVYLIFPIIYLILKNLIIYYNVSLAHQNAPKDINTDENILNKFSTPNMIDEQKAQVQTFKEVEPERISEQYPKVNKDINFTGNLAGVSTQSTQVLGSSIEDLQAAGNVGGYQDVQGYSF